MKAELEGKLYGHQKYALIAGLSICVSYNFHDEHFIQKRLGMLGKYIVVFLVNIFC